MAGNTVRINYASGLFDRLRTLSYSYVILLKIMYETMNTPMQQSLKLMSANEVDGS